MSVYDMVGAFLLEQRLEPNPANYTFAYHVLTDPDGPLAKAVASLTDGGVRLSARDMESLGRDIDRTRPGDGKRAEGLVAQTQMQVEGFEDIIQTIRAETANFGRDLEASAERLRESGEHMDDGAAIEDVLQITASMAERANTAETQLERATREASELRHKLEEARGDARKDPLTGLPNRRAFEEGFAALAAQGRPGCVAVIDVDHFKSVNDRFGHAVGDRVLKAIAAELDGGCNGQLVARYGGEEFVVLFADMPVETAQAMLEGARGAIANKRYRLRETDEPLGSVTVSAGLVAVGAGEACAAAVQRADALLYRAKDAGRNQIAA